MDPLIPVAPSLPCDFHAQQGSGPAHDRKVQVCAETVIYGRSLPRPRKSAPAPTRTPISADRWRPWLGERPPAPPAPKPQPRPAAASDLDALLDLAAEHLARRPR